MPDFQSVKLFHNSPELLNLYVFNFRDFVLISPKGIAKMDAELRSKSGEYAIVEQKLNQIKQSTTGSLVSRDITKDIESAKIVNSKYLTTLFVVVPKYDPIPLYSFSLS